MFKSLDTEYIQSSLIEIRSIASLCQVTLVKLLKYHFHCMSKVPQFTRIVCIPCRIPSNMYFGERSNLYLCIPSPTKFAVRFNLWNRDQADKLIFKFCAKLSQGRNFCHFIMFITANQASLWDKLGSLLPYWYYQIKLELCMRCCNTPREVQTI